jgi:hypothetical protein
MPHEGHLAPGPPGPVDHRPGLDHQPVGLVDRRIDHPVEHAGLQVDDDHRGGGAEGSLGHERTLAEALIGVAHFSSAPASPRADDDFPQPRRPLVATPRSFGSIYIVRYMPKPIERHTINTAKDSGSTNFWLNYIIFDPTRCFKSVC